MDHIKKNLDLISDLKKNKAKLESFVDDPNYYFEDNKNDNLKKKKKFIRIKKKEIKLKE